MGSIVRKVIITCAKKASNVNPSDFVTQDNVSSLVQLAGHVIKLLF